jgi:capsular polysaccharide transport system permease protein
VTSEKDTERDPRPAPPVKTRKPRSAATGDSAKSPASQAKTDQSRTRKTSTVEAQKDARIAARRAARSKARAEARLEARAEARTETITEAEAEATSLPKTAPASQTAPLDVSDTAPTIFAAGPVDLLTPEEERFFSRTTRWSFIALVLLPFLAACAYLLTVAADRYAVEVKFAVRSPTGLPATDLIGIMTGGATGTTRSDSYMVVEYLQSRQFLDELSTRLDLSEIYAVAHADPLMRLAPDATKEDQVDYLARVVQPSYDATAEIITVEAQAFSPADALRVANGVMETADEMVNRLSDAARKDTARLAEAELSRAEAALRAQRNAIAVFRETEQRIDPNQSVTTQENVLRDLQSQLATARAEMRSLRAFLSPDAPSIRVLQSRIASTEKQIVQERANLGRGRGDDDESPPADESETLNSAVTLYEALAVDLEFHERAYISALSSLEAARVEADRQQRYLATVVLPALPESATYPKVLLSLALVFAVCFFSWGIVSMLIHVVREHMR